MRLISQNEDIDIPYENSIITIEGKRNGSGECKYFEIRATNFIGNGGRDYINNYCMGKYYSKEKARTVLASMRRQYREYLTSQILNLYFYFPEDE